MFTEPRLGRGSQLKRRLVRQWSQSLVTVEVLRWTQRPDPTSQCLHDQWY